MCVCVFKPVHAFGTSTTQSAHSLSQVPSCHLDSGQTVWSGFRNQKPGKVQSDGHNHRHICYHHHLTHSAGNPVLCRRTSKNHFLFSWVLFIFFFANLKAQTDRYFSSSKLLVTLHFFPVILSPLSN